MPIPIILNPGLVSIYGAGNVASQTGIIAPNGFLFGQVDQIWGSEPFGNQVGNYVMFYEADLMYRLVYSNYTYTIIPQDKITLIEEIVS